MLSRKAGSTMMHENHTSANPLFSNLRVNQPGDSFEQEANHAAEQVMIGSGARLNWSLLPGDPGLQRKCSCGTSGGQEGGCEECKQKSLQRKASGTVKESFAPPIVHEVLRSPGQPLDKQTREYFEPRFGHDFSKVRIHADGCAAESARAVNADAYTVGHAVVLGARHKSMTAAEQSSLLAHELVHVAQQGAREYSTGKKLEITSPFSDSEREAERGSQIIERGSIGQSRRSYPLQLQRRPTNPYQDSGNPDLYQQAEDAIRESELRRAGRQPVPGPAHAVFSGSRLTVGKSGQSWECDALTDPSAPTPTGSYCIRKQGEGQRWGGLKGTLGRLGGVFASTAVRQDRSRWYLLEPKFTTSRSKLDLHFGTRSEGCVTVTDADCFQKLENILNSPGTVAGTGYDGYPPGNSEGVKNEPHAVECAGLLEVK